MIIIDEPTDCRQPDTLEEDCDGGCAETIGRGHRRGDQARCHDCDRLIRWNEEIGDWQHCEEPGRGCFLIDAEREERSSMVKITEGEYVLDQYDGAAILGRVGTIDEYVGDVFIVYEQRQSDGSIGRHAPTADFDEGGTVERMHLPLGPGDGDYSTPGGIGCEDCDAIFGTAEAADAHEARPHDDDGHRQALLADLAPRARGEILADVESGRVPSDVADFSSLHDYVDANEYGSPNLREHPMSLIAAMQEDLDQWIRSGEMRKTWQGLHGEE